MASVAVRGDVSGLAAAAYCTVPLPVPPAPAVMVSHAALLVAVHEQVAPVVTPIEPLPPAASSDWLVLDSEYVQGGGAPAPACVTVSVTPAAVRAPVRSGPVLAAT